MKHLKLFEQFIIESWEEVISIATKCSPDMELSMMVADYPLTSAPIYSLNDFIEKINNKTSENWRLATIEEYKELEKKGKLELKGSSSAYWTSDTEKNDDVKSGFMHCVYRGINSSLNGPQNRNYEYPGIIVREFTKEEKHKYRGSVQGIKFGI